VPSSESYEGVKLAKHAQDIGMDFVIILIPTLPCAATMRCTSTTVRRRAGGYRIVPVQHSADLLPISEHLAKRLATIPNICGFKQAGPAPAATISLREAVGDTWSSASRRDAVAAQPERHGRPLVLNYCPICIRCPAICRA